MDGLRKSPPLNGGEEDASSDHQISNNPLTEPLLSPNPIEDNDECEYEENHKFSTSGWPLVSFHQFFVKWAKWFAGVITRSLSWLANIILCGRTYKRGYELDLTPLQEERILRLLLRLDVSFDATNTEHQEALKALWYLCFPDVDLHGLVTEQWKQMGWQGNDPSTDFRGGGFTSLENLLFFAKKYPKTFQHLLCKKGNRRAAWEYPFATAGVNITFMLTKMLDLRSAKLNSSCGMRFQRILAEDEMAFDVLYCVAFKLMDTLWLAMHASYMEFNAVMEATRNQLERELMMESVTRIEEMPSYSLLS